MMESRRALIATHNLIDFGGSEIFSLEVASELRDMGWEVSVAAFLIGEPIASVFRQRGFEIFDLLRDLSVFECSYDLVWTHHGPVYHHLFFAKEVQTKKLIHCALSPFEVLEAVPPGHELINWLLVNSQETRDIVEKAIGVPDNRILLFPNSAPTPFWERQKCSHLPTPTRIAIVSNHCPDELLQATQILADSSVHVTHIGIGGKPMLVTPDLLLRYDVVITIGKTVQYCLALNLPVYCYDRFGGPGWLTDQNFEVAAYRNFSGRGFHKKAAEEIVHDLLFGYQNALLMLSIHRQKAQCDFDLRKNLIKLINDSPTSRIGSTSVHDMSTILRQHRYYIGLLGITKPAYERLAILEEYVTSLKSMWFWKIAAPLRVVERRVRAWLQGMHRSSEDS